jgi:DNA (cytosine-5)-methyltransferase 1
MTLRDAFKGSLGIEHYYRHPRSYARRAVFSIDEPSPTVRGVNRPVPDGYPGHQGDTAPAEDVRPLTTRERALVQTFPGEFRWDESKTNVEQMIGNAVPVNLAAYVAGHLGDYLRSTPPA